MKRTCIVDSLFYRASEAGEKNFTILKLSSIVILNSSGAVGPNILKKINGLHGGREKGWNHG